MRKTRVVSRREFLTAVGGLTAICGLFPKTLLASGQNEITAIRTGKQPGNLTRLVIETTRRPEFALSYPTNQLVIQMQARHNATPNLTAGTLVRSINQADNKIVVNLTRSITQIPQDRIMVLSPMNGNQYRLVLDIGDGTTAVAQANTARAASNVATPAATGPGTARAATTNQVVATTSPRRRGIIVIDPGHGGADPGAIGVSGAREKDIVLQVSRKLRDRLNREGYTAILTRDRDVFLNLGTRARMGEKHNADLFLSIHANANPRPQVRGFSVYTLSQKASDAEAQRVAEAENAADRIAVDNFGGYATEIRMVLSSLQQNHVAAESDKISMHISKAVRAKNIDRVDRERRSAPFAVLRSTTPSALVELGHLSNAAEERLLRNGAHQDRLVTALVNAVGKYEFIS